MKRAQGGLWLALVLLGAAAILVVRQTRVAAEQAGRIAQLDREVQELRVRIDRISRENEALVRELEAAAETEEHSTPGFPARRPATPAPFEETQVVKSLRESLANAQAAVARLEARISEFEAESHKSAEENKRLTAAQEDMSREIAIANRLVEALQQELKGKENRLIQLDLSAKRLQEESNANAQKASQSARLIAELQEIQRRREVYLTNILRRYKDLTDQYRSLSGALENRRDNEGTGPGAAEISRIQNAISLAEEDLRQLGNLDAQAARLQRKFGGR